jgi:Putative DNA-binding domain
MARDLFIDPIDDIKFDDIANLVSNQPEEGIRLEFKRDLSTSDGRPDRWMRDQSAIGRVARDDIAKEVVAFANAYGGVIIVGIAETEDHPHRAKELASPQIPRVADCAEQLISALRSIIDPPLPMLDVRGVVSSANGEGVVLIRVPSSPSAPHGYGTPPAAYVRHGSESRPLSMRELQSTFFERRTRLERVTSRQNELSALAQELWASRRHGESQGGPIPSLDLPAIQFRCSLVPTDDFAIDNFPDRFLGSPQTSPRPEIDNMTTVVALPTWTSEWRRRYRAVEHVRGPDPRLYSWASLEADGVFNQVAIVVGLHSEPFKTTPAWFPKVILQGMIMAEWFRRWASRPDVEYALDGELWNAGAQVCTSRNLGEWDSVPFLHESIGPYSVGNRATFQETFDVIECELWDAFRLRRQEELKFDLTKVFQSIGL